MGKSNRSVKVEMARLSVVRLPDAGKVESGAGQRCRERGLGLGMEVRGTWRFGLCCFGYLGVGVGGGIGEGDGLLSMG